MAFFLLLSNLSPYINPIEFWPTALLGLGFPFLLLGNILILIAWAYFKKWQLIIPLMAVIFSYNSIDKIFSIKDPQKPSDKILTVNAMSYNVKNFDLYNWENNLKSKDLIFKAIQKENPDIIAFQEFYTNRFVKQGKWDNIKYLNEQLDYPHHYFDAKFVVKESQKFGMAIFSKYPIVNTGSIKLKGSNTNGIIYTDLLIESDTIRFLNVHLQSIHLGEEDYQVAEELNSIDIEGTKSIVKKLRNAFIKRSHQTEILLKTINESPYPTIVSGDFNDTPISYAYNSIANVLKDAYKTAGVGFGGTYVGPLPSYRIDYFFTSNNINVFDYQTINFKKSDHYPIRISFFIE